MIVRPRDMGIWVSERSTAQHPSRESHGSRECDLSRRNAATVLAVGSLADSPAIRGTGSVAGIDSWHLCC